MPEGQETQVTARVLGTFGYFDPEYTSVCISVKQYFFSHVSTQSNISLLDFPYVARTLDSSTQHVKIK